MTANTRLSCCIPFCRRTTKAEYGFHEWICGPHWRMVPARLKARRRLARRLARRAEARFRHLYVAQGKRFAEAQWQRVEAARALAHQLWIRCKEAAVQSAGIAGT